MSPSQFCGLYALPSLRSRSDQNTQGHEITIIVFKLRLFSFSHISLLLSKLYLPALLTVRFE